MAQRFVPGTDQRTTVPWTASMVGAVLAGGWVAARTGPAATDKAPRAAAREHPFKAIMRFTSSGMGEPHGSCGYPSFQRATRMPVVGKQDGSSVRTGAGRALPPSFNESVGLSATCARVARVLPFGETLP